MAARDILTLDNSIAPRLIRCLYIVALVLIAVMVLLGLLRGVRVMSHPPLPPHAMTGNATPTPAPDTTAQQPRPGVTAHRFGERRFMERRFGRRAIGPFGTGRNPVVGGIWIILGTLLRGAIMLMVARILAEIGLAVLAMPRRSEI